jgi:hypothetical protein
MTAHFRILLMCLFFGIGSAVGARAAPSAPGPEPLLDSNHAVDWWFAFKFNAETAPTSASDPRRRDCRFGGTRVDYDRGFSQSYAFASSNSGGLREGTELIGTSLNDPLGATFDRIYNGDFSYVVWNDQFYDDPRIAGCAKFCGPPWAHSKGLVAWNDAGDGVVLQVTTPSWPAAASKDRPRPSDGNTLGCVGDNNVKVNQHFFALRLDHDDVAKVLDALRNEGAVAIPNIEQVVHVRSSGPVDLSGLVSQLGARSPSGTALKSYQLSTGVVLISKPASLAVPPWQLISSALGGEPIRVATWWTGGGALPSTLPGKPGCWNGTLAPAGRVEIAISGTWRHRPIGLAGGNNPNGNHAKIGVSLPGGHNYVILGDENADGRLVADCAKEQNGRGGLFYVLKDPDLFAGVTQLLAGTTAAEGDRTCADIEALEDHLPQRCQSNRSRRVRGRSPSHSTGTALARRIQR